MVVAIFAGSLTGESEGPVLAVNDEPLREGWEHSEWGPDDKASAVNRTTPEMVLIFFFKQKTAYVVLR